MVKDIFGKKELPFHGREVEMRALIRSIIPELKVDLDYIDDTLKAEFHKESSLDERFTRQMVHLHGLPGYGKTRLFKELKFRLNYYRSLEKTHQLTNVVYASLDFETNTSNTIQKLYDIRTEFLRRYPRLKFKNFDDCLKTYVPHKYVSGLQFSGKKRLIDTKEVLEDLSSIDVIANISGRLSQGILVFTLLGHLASQIWEHEKEKLEAFSSRDIEDLELDEWGIILAIVLAEDINDYYQEMEDKNELQLLLLLDTYEDLWLDYTEYPKPNDNTDLWIRALLEYTNFLKIISFGRRSVVWAKDKEWKEKIASIPLDILDEDACKKIVGAFDRPISPGVLDHIVKNSSGVPLYLNIAYEIDRNNIKREKESIKEDFPLGLDDLIKRYLRTVKDNTEKQLIKVLSCMPVWGTEITQAMTARFSYLYFEPILTYVKNLSFVEKVGDGKYKYHKYIQDTFQDSLRSDNPKLFAEYHNFLLDQYRENYGNVEYVTEAVDFFDYFLYSYYQNFPNKESFEKLVDFLNTLGGGLIHHKMLPWLLRIEAMHTNTEFTGKKMHVFYNNLAGVYTDMGEHDKAVELYENVLEKERVRLGQYHPDTHSLMTNLALVYYRKGEHAKAMELYEDAAEKSKIILGEDHPDTLTTLTGIALSYSHKGEYTKAKELFEQVVEKQKTILGLDHPSTLTSMNNLASVYSDMGKYARAVELFEQVVTMRKAVLGEDHPKTLTSIHNMALAYSRKGDYGKAKKLYVEVMEKEKNILGDDHPDTLTTMGNLADVHFRTGEHSRAVELYEEVLMKEEAILGQDHPSTLNTMDNIAFIWLRTGKYAQALSMFREVRKKQKRILSKDHPASLITMTNIADVYSSVGEYEKAEKLFNHVLKKQIKIIGKNHPNTLRTAAGIAFVYFRTDDYVKAQKLFEQVVEKKTKILGENHPDTLASMNNLALVYSDTERYTKAIEYLARVIDGLKERLGEDHPNILASMNNLALAYHRSGQHDKAKELFEQVAEKLKTGLGQNPSDTLNSMHNLASTYSDIGEYDEAINLFEEVLKSRRSILGENHPDTLTTVNNLGLAYSKKGEYAKAIELLEEGMEREKVVLGEDHPDTLITTTNLANAYFWNEDFRKACTTFEFLREMKRTLLGDNHDEIQKLNKMIAILSSMD